MDQTTPRHEKIRFRRGDIARLHTLPSAAGQAEWTPRRAPRAGLRIAAWIASLVTGLAIMAIAAAVYLATYGVDTGFVRLQLESAIERALGADVDASFGMARVSFEAGRLVAVRVNGVTIRSNEGAPLVEAGSVSAGLRLMPLLGGRIEVGSLALADATVTLPPGEGRGVPEFLTDSRGLVAPDLAGTTVFVAAHAMLDMLDKTVGSIDVERVRFVSADAVDRPALSLVEGQVHSTGRGVASLAVTAEAEGRMLDLSGSVSRNPASGRISDLKLELEAEPATVVASSGEDGPPGALGAFRVAVEGAEGIGGEPSRLVVAASADSFVLPLDQDDSIAGSASLAATLVGGSGKLEIERLRVLSDRSQFQFHGAVGPRPESDGDPGYRFELVSDGSTVAPQDSPEPALPFVARVGGWYDTTGQRLVLEAFGVRTNGGELLGTGEFEFTGEGSPGIYIAASVPEMPVAHVKQLWPFMAAPGARRWAMNNLFGGTVSDSTLQYRVAPGRIGNGIPLTRDEVSGRFVVEGTRFDVAGRMPPVRSASGTIAFGGNDVDVELSSGTAYMASGRSVGARNGFLRIPDAHLDRVVGSLDIEVFGSADAITELASYEPIDAMRHTGMKADDFTGSVEGTVTADIPLHGEFAEDELPWLVDLTFANLSVLPPVDGQKVTEASGRIVVDPAKAVINAKAKLNGAPAEVELVEPFESGSADRKRDIAMVLDDKARSALVPGLDGLLTGPVRVRFDAASRETQRIEADITDAKLHIPWAGWSKGAGVEATVAFDLGIDGNASKLTDFSVKGKTFHVNGELTLDGGSLSSARFSSLALNREDDVSLTIDRKGKGYDIAMSGNSFDARSVIKRYLSEDGDGGRGAPDDTRVDVAVQVERMAGFHGEAISGAKLSLSATGDRIARMEVSARSARGGAIAVRNGEANGARFIEMQSADAGSFLRFLDVYQHMEGGAVRLAMTGPPDGSSMKGQVDVSDFWIVDEPKLASIVAKPLPGDSRSLNQAVRGDLDVSRAQFQKGYAVLEKRSGFLALEQGVLRGPLIGSTFQGTLYDERGNMDLTGTFMPAYGLNRIFGEIPLFGEILGNGRDRGLIGVTYRLSGKAAEPRLQINPLSVIAPGIFRTIFEFR
ncbi:MAG: DUF3971 domain-containing protein [Rhizobiaceae bacterium]